MYLSFFVLSTAHAVSNGLQDKYSLFYVSKLPKRSRQQQYWLGCPLQQHFVREDGERWKPGWFPNRLPWLDCRHAEKSKEQRTYQEILTKYTTHGPVAVVFCARLQDAHS